MRTRVGYAGGTSENPTYRKIGDHTEALQIDFDPQWISFEELMQTFWLSHDPTERPWSKQYMSIAFFHSTEQEQVLLRSAKSEAEKRKKEIKTKIMTLDKFYLAEDYHQKYYLQQMQEVMKVLKKIYPDFQDFVHATISARLNGTIAGYGTLQTLEKEVASSSLSPEDQKKLVQILGRMQNN